jgi:hypothetical protein
MGSYQKPGSKTVKKMNQDYEQVGNPQKTDQEISTMERSGSNLRKGTHVCSSRRHEEFKQARLQQTMSDVKVQTK